MQKKAKTQILEILNRKIKVNRECIGHVMGNSRYSCDEHKQNALNEVDTLLDIIDELESLAVEVAQHE